MAYSSLKYYYALEGYQNSSNEETAKHEPLGTNGKPLYIFIFEIFLYLYKKQPSTNRIHVTSTSYFYCQEAFSAHQHPIPNVSENALKDR